MPLVISLAQGGAISGANTGVAPRIAVAAAFMHVYRWMRAFDMAHYGVEYASAADPADSHLVVARRRAG